MEQEEFIRMKRTVQSVKERDLDRYNSLRQRERNDEDKIEKQMLNMNEEEKLKEKAHI